MSKNYFEIIRAGINTTFQDLGRKNLYHIGIPFSGAMDSRNFLLANKIVGNKLDLPVIEFAYQGPLLKFNGNKINIVITGDVVFKIKQKEIMDIVCTKGYYLIALTPLFCDAFWCIITSSKRNMYGHFWYNFYITHEYPFLIFITFLCRFKIF